MPQSNNTNDALFITNPDNGGKIAYHHTPPTDEKKPTGIVFLGGFRSDMNGSKAVALESWCMAQGRQFL
ncbi:MAG: hypothetical protein OEL50_01625, partial [Rhodospirillaceae bacterium]|nr:hypothetical protein [Rhodospirillaceae bacterium]